MTEFNAKHEQFEYTYSPKYKYCITIFLAKSALICKIRIPLQEFLGIHQMDFLCYALPRAAFEDVPQKAYIVRLWHEHQYDRRSKFSRISTSKTIRYRHESACTDQYMRASEMIELLILSSSLISSSCIALLLGLLGRLICTSVCYFAQFLCAD